jgi:hypothetical protein
VTTPTLISAAGKFNPDATLSDFQRWTMTGIVIALLLAVLFAWREATSGHPMKALAVVGSVAALAVGVAIAVNPLGIGGSILAIFQA